MYCSGLVGPTSTRIPTPGRPSRPSTPGRSLGLDTSGARGGAPAGRILPDVAVVVKTVVVDPILVGR